MKKITLLLLFLTITYSVKAQFPESFDDGLPSDWTTFIGVNGLGTVQNWRLAGTTNPYMICSDENAGGVTEDWLVSPITSITTTNTLLDFYEQTVYTQPYEPSAMSVRVSTTSQTDIGTFTSLSSLSATEVFDGTTRTVDLSAYEGQSIYIAWVLEQDYGDGWLVDDIVLSNANASAPDCAENPVPAIGATDVVVVDEAVTLSWSFATSGDLATGYELFFGTTSGALSPLGKFSGTTINITGMALSTTYYWKIVPENAGGSATGCPEWSYTTENPPAPIVPIYSADFSTYPADRWSEASGAYGSPSGTSSSFSADDFGNDTSHANGKSARVNIYGSTTDEYLISPKFNLSGGTYYLNYEIALTGYAASTSATLGDDDYLALLVTQDEGSTWQELSRWDANTAISNTGESAAEITLSGYGADVQFSFYAFSDTSNEDTDLFIDNFQITTGTLGTERNTLEGFTLYPTLVKEEVNFRSQNKVEVITVFNLLGQKVFSGAPNANNASINLSNLRPGTYLVKVKSGNSIGSYKIIKE
jgi:hypothetical protein